MHWGHVKSVFYMTSLCILASVIITIAVHVITGEELKMLVLLIAIIAPLIIGSVVTSILIRLILREEQEKRRIYKESAREARNILREFLHDVHYFESEAERIGGFDGKTMQHLEQALSKARESLDRLDNVGDLTGQNQVKRKQGNN